MLIYRLAIKITTIIETKGTCVKKRDISSQSIVNLITNCSLNTGNDLTWNKVFDALKDNNKAFNAHNDFFSLIRHNSSKGKKCDNKS